MGEEFIGIAICASVSVVNAVFRDARVTELNSAGERQVDTPLPTIPPFERAAGAKSSFKFRNDFLPHFKRLPSDARSDRGQQSIRHQSRSKFFHTLNRCGYHSRHHPAPSCMNGGYRSPPLICQQYRDTIRHPNRQHMIRNRRHQPVCFHPILKIRFLRDDNIPAMHLVYPASLRLGAGNRGLKPLIIMLNPFIVILSCAAAGISKIERIKG